MILLIRHGQTAANAAGLLLGRADPPLTDLGRRQAAASARVVGEVTHLVSSPLQTCSRDGRGLPDAGSRRPSTTGGPSSITEPSKGGRSARSPARHGSGGEVTRRSPPPGGRVAGGASACGCGRRVSTWPATGPTATSLWSATCRRSRLPSPGRWASRTPSPGACSSTWRRSPGWRSGPTVRRFRSYNETHHPRVALRRSPGRDARQASSCCRRWRRGVLLIAGRREAGKG